MESEEKYEDVLQDMEYGIISMYRDNPGMSDYAVMRALEAVIAHYVAEKLGRVPRKFPLGDIEKEILERMIVTCDWWLGHSQASVTPEAAPKSIDEVIQCLKRILKSAQRWNKQGGNQGYLRFASQFIPLAKPLK
jgi:hypothetical protein